MQRGVLDCFEKVNDLQEILAVYLLAPLPKCEEYFWKS